MAMSAEPDEDPNEPLIESADEVEVWCDRCGHAWTPRKNPIEAKRPRCNSCEHADKSDLYVEADNGLFNLHGQPAPPDVQRNPLEADGEDGAASGEAGSRALNGESGNAVKPDDFGLETEDEATQDVIDIFTHVIETFPSFGKNSPKRERITEYLIQRGKNNLTPPSPAELREWASTINGIGNDVARNLHKNYEQQLTNAVASGRIDREELKDVYSTALTQLGNGESNGTPTEGAMSPQMAAALQDNNQSGGGGGGSPVEQMIQQSDSMGPEAMLLKEMDTEEMDPMTAMLLMERMKDDRDQSQSSDVPDELSDALSGLADAVDNINTRIDRLEDRVDNDNDSSDDSPLGDMERMAEMRELMIEMGMASDPRDQQQAAQQSGGDSGEATQMVQMLMQRIDGLEEQLQSGGGANKDDLESHIGRILEQTDDPEQARDLLAIAGKTSVDPEVRKKELELEMEREKLDNKNNSLEKLLDGFQKVADRASSSFAEAIMSNKNESQNAQRVRGEPQQQAPQRDPRQQATPDPDPDPEQVAEVEMDAPEAEEDDSGPQVRECDNCGTEFDVPPHQPGYSCPDCGMGLTKCEECQHPTETPSYDDVEFKVCPGCFQNPVSVDDPECTACGWSGDADQLVGECVFCDNCGVPLILERTAAEVQQAARQQQYVSEQEPQDDDTDPDAEEVEEVIEETREVIEDDSGIPDVPDTSPAPDPEYEDADGESESDDTERDEAVEQDDADDADGEEEAEDISGDDGGGESDDRSNYHGDEDEDDGEESIQCACGQEFEGQAQYRGHKAHCDEAE